MDLYLFTLLLGFGGLLLMAVLGLSHGHSPAQGHHAPAAGHGAHAPVPHHGLVPPKFKTVHVSAKGHAPRSHKHLLGLLAPQVLFGLLLGFGAVGTLLHPLIRLPLLLLVVSALGAYAFQRGLLAPLWTFLLGFASKPALTLDALVLEEGQAATNFDDAGSGLVSVDLDGQTRQILGTLCREDRAQGTRIRTGDRLFIQAVDATRNTCTVSRQSY